MEGKTVLKLLRLHRMLISKLLKSIGAHVFCEAS